MRAVIAVALLAALAGCTGNRAVDFLATVAFHHLAWGLP